MIVKSKYEIRDEIVERKFGSGTNFWNLLEEERKEIMKETQELFADQFGESVKAKVKEAQAIFAEANKLAREAQDKLNAATSLLDEHGLGMYFQISPLSQAYQAEEEDVAQFFGVESFEEIEELVEELEISVGRESDDYGGAGWQHSAVCF